MDDSQGYWQKEMRRRLSRRKLLKAGALAGLGVAVGGTVLGCSSNSTQEPGPAKPGQTPQATQPKYGGVLKIGYASSPGYLSPGAARGGSDGDFMSVYSDNLVGSNPDGSPDPESSLAPSWKQDDPTTITFTLRQGVKFQDGTDYDAQAQKTYFEYLLDENRAKLFAYRGMIDSITAMEVVDKYTLRLRLKQPFPPLLANLGGPAGMTVSPTAIEKLGADIQTRPVTTGAFSVKSYTQGGEWVFEKNPSYWRKGLPYLDGITFVELPDDRVRAASLQSGQIDVAFYSGPSDVTQKLKQDPNIVLAESQGGPTFITLNHALPPLDNLKIRQAVAYCIDREAINKAVYQGLGKPAYGGLMQPGFWAFKDLTDVVYKFDINKAKQLIAESGLKTPIPLKFITRDTPAEYRMLAELIIGWLKDAGFDASLEVFSMAEFRRRMWDALTYHLGISGGGAKADPDSNFSTFVTSAAYYNAGRKTTDPAQKRIDDLVKQGASNYDQKERKKIYDELQTVQAQNVLAQIFLVYSVPVLAIRTNVKGTERVWNRAWSTFNARFLWKD